MLSLMLVPLLLAGPIAPTKAAKPEAQPLAWLPEGTVQVTYFHPTQAALLRAAPGLFKARQAEPPMCWAQTVATFDATYQVQLAVGAKAVNLAHGKLNRDAFEKCLGEVLATLQMPRTVAREGRVTVLSSKDGNKTYLAWPEGGWLAWHDDRASVEKFLGAASTRGGNPELAAMFRRVEPLLPIWSISRLDMATRLLKVRSTGYFFSAMAITRETTEVAVTFLFATPADAASAAQALTERGADASLPAPLRSAIAGMNPSVHGAEATVNVLPFFQVRGAAEAALSLIGQ